MKWKKQETEVRSNNGPLLSKSNSSKRRSKKTLPEISRNKVLVFLLLIVIVFASYLVWVNRDKINADSLVDGAGAILGDSTANKPGFNTLGNNDNNGKFDNEKNVFSYQEDIYDTTLVVSQQPMPEEFKGSENNIKKLALSLHNSQSINKLRAGNYAAYLVKIGEEGQTAIVSTDELLIFIRSPEILTTQQWQSYIDNLVQ